MAILKVNYNQLSNAKSYANTSATKLEGYASNINSQISSKIRDIPNGQSNITEEALKLVNEKIKQLNKDTENLRSFSKNIGLVEEKVREVDKNVANKINTVSIEFAKKNNIKVNPVSEFFKQLITGVVNSTSIGRWISDTYNKVKEYFSDLKTSLKHWYKVGGGKFICDIVMSVGVVALATVAIIALIPELIAAATFGAALVAVASIISSTFTIINGITNIMSSINAYDRNKNGDPAWANIYGEMNKFSDFLRFSDKKGNFTLIAGFLDCLENAADIALIFKDFGDIAKLLTKPGKENGFKSLKKLFGSQGNKSSVGIIGSRFKEFDGYKKKFTFNSVKNGLVSLLTDRKYQHELCNTIKSFGDELVDLVKYKKSIVSQGKSLLQKLFTGSSAEKLNASNVLKSTIRGDINKFISRSITTISEKFNTGEGLASTSKAILKGDAFVSISELVFPTIDTIVSGITDVFDLSKVDIFNAKYSKFKATNSNS